MIDRIVNFKLRKNLFLGTALIVLAGIVLYLYIEKRGFSYQELIIVFSVLTGAVIAFGREFGIRIGFVLWVLTLALGYRTVEVTRDLAIHPAEVLLWFLLVCILFQRRLVSNARLTFPLWLWMLIPFWVLAWWPMIAGNAPWDRMLNEFRNFLLLIPLMIVMAVVLQQQRYWRYLLLSFFFASSCIAFMGILEYWFPEVAKLFPAFMKNAKPTVSEEGFIRAQFSFWGGPAATFICVLALPAAIVLAKWWSRWLHLAIIGVGSVLQLLAIYIGGYRSIWLVLLVQAVAACLLGLKKQRVVVALLCLVVLVGGYELVPRTSERAMSAIAALQGNPTDTSATGRQTRALGALESTIERPFGSGWSAAGWVHSDFLQVAANLGIFAGLIFLGGYLFTMVRLGRQALAALRSNENGELGLSLLLSFIAVGGILAMEGVSVLPQLVLPVWFVWALTDKWLRQTANQRVSELVPATPYSNQLAAARLAALLKTDV